MRQKRRREGGGGVGRGGEGQLPAPLLKKRCRSFDLEIRGCRHLQELATSYGERIEAAISRIPEEVTKVLTRFFNFNRIPGSRIVQNPPPSYKLSFVNSLSDEIFTKREIRAADGGFIKIRITVNNQQGFDCPRLLSTKVKIVVLDGDFNADNHEGWTSKEFRNHIVRPRDKVGVVHTGDLELKLKNGEANLENISFMDNSSFTRSGKFRLGVMVIDDFGERVQEGITEPFTVKDRRGEGYKKRDIPSLDDEVFRLRKIAKNGVFHEALKRSGIPTVKHFLRMYYKDAKALRDILSKVPESVWTTIVDHAKKCDPGGALYSHFIAGKDIRLFFSSVGQIVGATIADKYNAFGDLDTSQKALLEEWSRDVYECMTYHQPDYEMYNREPRPINRSAFQESIMGGTRSTQPTDKVVHETDQQDSSKDNEFSGSRSQGCTFKRIGSVRGRPLPSTHGNNDEPSFDIDIQLDSGTEIQHESPDANCITGSVTLQCPATTENEIIGSIALDHEALTLDQGSYTMPFTNYDSQCAPPFSLNMQASGLPTQNSFRESEIQEILNNWEQSQLWENFLHDSIAQFSAPNLDEASLQSSVDQTDNTYEVHGYAKGLQEQGSCLNTNIGFSEAQENPRQLELADGTDNTEYRAHVCERIH
ncbi:hypothetical protein EJB05_01178, partial [Eragrostis curvula]